MTLAEQLQAAAANLKKPVDAKPAPSRPMTLQEQLQAQQAKLKKVPVAKDGEFSQIIQDVDAATGKEAVAAQEKALQQMLEA